MSTTETAEYAAFGPWVDDVVDAAGVPRLYRDHPIDFARTELVLKVPRNIARRDAHPGMDLYDALVVVDADRTTVLTRAGNTYTTRSVPHASLVAIVDSVHLLDGVLTLHVEQGEPLVLGYNGSSRAVMSRLIAVLRRLIPARGIARSALRSSSGPLADLDALDGDRDRGILGAWLELTKREPDVLLAGAHGFRAVTSAGGSEARLMHRLRPTVLKGAVVGVSPDGIHVLHRRESLDQGKVEDLSIVHTFLFHRPTARVDARPHAQFAGHNRRRWRRRDRGGRADGVDERGRAAAIGTECSERRD